MVEPRTVESRRHRQVDVAGQFFQVLGRIDAFRVVALVQDEALEYGFAVDEHSAAVDVHGSHAEVTADDVFAVADSHIV